MNNKEILNSNIDINESISKREILKENKNINNLKEKTIEDINNKEYLIEHYVDDPEIIKEYKELFTPIKKRLKYTFYYNVAVCSLSIIYAKNLGFYITKYFPNMGKGLLNLVLFSTFHAFAFSGILIGGNLAILGINPKKFMKKYREIDEKIMSNDPYKDLTLKGFIDGVSEGFSKQAEKMKEQKPNNNTNDNTNNNNKDNNNTEKEKIESLDSNTKDVKV